MQKFKSVEELVNQLKPYKPVYCIRKNSILSASSFFQKNFPGKILYAVKTNPHPEIIKTLIKSGIDQFDVASIQEIKVVKKFDNSIKCSFMHTVKSRENIKEAYYNFGIKTLYILLFSFALAAPSLFYAVSKDYLSSFQAAQGIQTSNIQSLNLSLIHI